VSAKNIYRGSAPVEYAVAADRFLAAANISDASRRVYRVALQTWAWLLVERTPPTGPERRGAETPKLTLARLDGPPAAETVRRALASRTLMVDPRTFARESSILRNAAHWWSAQGWITADAELAIKAYRTGPVVDPGAETEADTGAVTEAETRAAPPTPPDAPPTPSSTPPTDPGAPPTSDDRSPTQAATVQVSAAPPSVSAPPPTPSHCGPVIHTRSLSVADVFALRAPLREQALWRLVYESAAPIEQLLALDVSDLDFERRRVRPKAGPRRADRIGWGPRSAELLPLLTIGRGRGPVFRTERRAAGRVPAADRCPYTGRGRLSARQAAELFLVATRELDPTGRGWNLRDLRVAGRAARTGVRR
jgi:integrase/recombinase XerD